MGKIQWPVGVAIGLLAWEFRISWIHVYLKGSINNPSCYLGMKRVKIHEFLVQLGYPDHQTTGGTHGYPNCSRFLYCGGNCAPDKILVCIEKGACNGE